MDEAAEIPGWYAEARRRAAASSRRPSAADASAGSAAWPEFAPPVALSEGPLGAVQAADREIARQTARRARAVAEFAASRPASGDRAQGERGAMSAERWAARPEVLREVSEWAAPELSVALSIGQRSAETLLERSLLLVHRLPGVLAALEAGALHPGHLFPLLEQVASIADDAVRAEVEAALLRWAAGRVTTPAQLSDKGRRELLRRDLRGAARRLEKALAERGVSLRAEPVDGMAGLQVTGTVPEIHALYRALGAYADALPEDGRTRGQKMLDCLTELVLRPGECELPPVQVLLTLVASVGTLAGGDQPAEIDGMPVPAELARALVQALGPTPPAPEPAPGAAPEVWWQEEEQQLLARWSDELSERILAGEFDDETLWAGEPVPDEPESDDREEAELDPDRCPPATDLLAELDLPEDDGSEDGPPETRPCAGGPPDAGPPDTGSLGGRWWADADRAVADAGIALRDAEAALGHARRLVAGAQRAEAADEAAWRRSAAGRVTAAEDALAQLSAAGEAQRSWLAQLLAATGGGGLAERPRLALTDAVTGALLALTDLPGLRRAAHCGRPTCRRRPYTCTHDLAGRPGLGPPGRTDAYRPGAELDRFVRARDRRCRMPGCRRRVPKSGELDHNRRYPDGPTAAANLAGYCTADHRGKHQAPGWTHDLAPDGTLTVTTPTGLTAVTTPPPY